MADSVTLYPLGVGDAFTVEHWYMHFVLNVDGRELFVDCPAYIPKMLADNNAKGEQQITFDRYREILMTHLHADHHGGLEEVAYHQLFATKDPVKLYAPDWMLEQIWSMVLQPGVGPSYRGDGGAAALDWYFDPVPLQQPHDFGGFTVSSMRTRHIPRTLAYRFDFGNFTFGYSADAGFDQGLIDWLDECDVVVHEVWLGPTDELGGDIGILHTPLSDLLQLPEDFQRKTFLCHYRDDWRDFQDQLGGYRFLQQNKLYELVRDGQKVELATA